MPNRERSFVKPWKLVEHSESFEVQDAAEVGLCFIYFEDEPIRREMMKRLSKDDARRMATQIIAPGINPDDA